jgi:NAD(P)-dependent dehydrogenase (short-subunit alcohol dehydrogenase family)
MLSNNKALTVLVVAHNDASTLLATIDRIYRALVITIEEFSIVIFDDGSSDDTSAIAKTAAQEYPFVEVRRNARRLGAGNCVIQGSLNTESAYVVYVPADNTWLLRSFIELFGHLGKADVITSYSNDLLPAMSFPRRIISWTYTFLLGSLFRKGLHYYNGLTIYPAKYFRQRAVRAQGFGFQAEALLKAIAAGYSFLEIALPIDVMNLPTAKSVTLSNSVDAVKTMVRLCIEFYVLRNVLSGRLKSALQVSKSQGAEEIGLSQESGTHNPTPPVAALSTRGPLRIVISGASTGIGAHLAQTLADEGHTIFACARRGEKLAAMSQGYDRIRTFICDVADNQQVQEFIAAISERTAAIDGLINCAGGFGEIGSITVADADRWWGTIEVNLKGSFLLSQGMLPLLRKGDAPRIINFAGGGAFSPFPNFSAYACSKAALVRMTECLAAELAPLNVRVNAISPGFVPTEMHQATLRAGAERAGRMQFQRTLAILKQGVAPMENVIHCIRWMLSPAVDEMTGKTISSNFDPWQSPLFLESLPDIVQSDLYSLRRINIVNLPNGRLRTTLSHPWLNNVGAN